MAAMSDRLARAMAFKALQPLDGHRFADLVMTGRRPGGSACFHRLDHPVAQVLRIRLCHSGWPPPSRQIESKSH